MAFYSLQQEPDFQVLIEVIRQITFATLRLCAHMHTFL